MKKQRIPWEKAPKPPLAHHLLCDYKALSRAQLIGHSFDYAGDGWWHWMWASDMFVTETSDPSGLRKPKGINWKTSFTPAPRKRK